MATIAEKAKALEKEVTNLKALVKKLLAANENLSGQLKEFKSSKQVLDLSEDYVVLDGRKHKVMTVASAKEMVNEIRKRYVLDDTTVIAIDRSGA